MGSILGSPHLGKLPNIQIHLHIYIYTYKINPLPLRASRSPYEGLQGFGVQDADMLGERNSPQIRSPLFTVLLGSCTLNPI